MFDICTCSLFVPAKIKIILSYYHQLIIFIQKAFDRLIEAVVAKNNQMAMEWSRTPEWLTVEEFFKEGGCS
jgi:hypothetical protein